MFLDRVAPATMQWDVPKQGEVFDVADNNTPCWGLLLWISPLAQGLQTATTP
jgi:hypothetical protein